MTTWRRLRLWRPVAYVAVLSTVLGYLSYRWVFASPGQAEARLRRDARTLFNGPVGIEGARYAWSLGTMARRVEISGTTTPGAQPFLRLRHVLAGSEWCACPFATRLSVPSSPGNADISAPRSVSTDEPARVVQVCSAEVSLVPPSNAAESPWLLPDPLAALLAPESMQRLRSECSLDVYVDSADLVLAAAPGARDADSRRFALSALLVRRRPEGVDLSCRLARSASWESGLLNAALGWNGALRISGSLENLSEPRLLLALLPEPVASIAGTLGITGRVTADIRSLEFPRAGTPPSAVDVLVTWFDGGIGIQRFGLDLAHVRGSLRFERDAVCVGVEAAGAPLRAEVFGIPCAVSGRLENSRGSLHMTLERSPLRARWAQRLPAPWGSLLDGIALRGTLIGGVATLTATEDTARWDLECSFGDVVIANWPGVSIAGVVELSARGAMHAISSTVVDLVAPGVVLARGMSGDIADAGSASCRLETDADGVGVLSLRIAGSTAALRLRGRMAPGSLQAVVVRAEREGAQRLAELGDQTSPDDWRRAAGLDFSGFALAGTPGAPEFQALSADDARFAPQRP